MEGISSNEDNHFTRHLLRRKAISHSDHIIGQRLAVVGLNDVFYEPFMFPQEKHINLGNLQRMMLHVLQREPVEEVR